MVSALRLLVASCVALAACGEPQPEPPEQTESPLAGAYVSEALDLELEQMGARVQERGFSPEDDPWRGFLVDGATATERLTLRSGQCVVFVGVGSAHLRSLELTVHDGDGAEMARSGPGEWGVRYCAASSGVHFAVARAEGDGLFAVRRFRGPPGLAIRFDDLRPAPTEALQPPPAPGRSQAP